MVLDSHYARKIMPDPSLQGYSNLGMEEARITLVADQKTEQDHLSGFSEEKLQMTKMKTYKSCDDIENDILYNIVQKNDPICRGWA